jgi:hypothetical protein
VWVAVGAAGGVMAYRKSLEMAGQAKERGVLGNVQAVQQTATALGDKARALRDQVLAPPPAAIEPLAPLPPAAPVRDRRTNGA